MMHTGADIGIASKSSNSANTCSDHDVGQIGMHRASSIGLHNCPCIDAFMGYAVLCKQSTPCPSCRVGGANSASTPNAYVLFSTFLAGDMITRASTMPCHLHSMPTDVSTMRARHDLPALICTTSQVHLYIQLFNSATGLSSKPSTHSPTKPGDFMLFGVSWVP